MSFGRDTVTGCWQGKTDEEVEIGEKLLTQDGAVHRNREELPVEARGSHLFGWRFLTALNHKPRGAHQQARD